MSSDWTLAVGCAAVRGDGMFSPVDGPVSPQVRAWRVRVSVACGAQQRPDRHKHRHD